MPNYVTTQIIGLADAIDDLTRTNEDGKLIVDFALVIPEPENIETGNCSGQHEAGVICWRNWRIENWGTKWNGLDAEVEHRPDGTAQLRFDTAWSHPYEVIEAMSKKHPDALLNVTYADEDLGGNLGQYEIKNGNRVEVQDFAEYSDLAREFAAQIIYGKTYAELQKEWEA